MNRFLLLPLAMVFITSLFNPTATNAQDCGADNLHEYLMDSDSVYREAFLLQEQQIENIIQNQEPETRGGNQVYVIPVVVHVIHLGEAVGSGSNISDAQILGAIDGLNERFANLNGLGLDIEIQFCLATKDPDGCPTTGINRVDGSGVPNYASFGINSTGNCSDGAPEDDIKSLSRWPVADYYNIWTVNFICHGALLGYAYYPNGNANDGTVIQSYSMVNWSTVLTHEVGHGFNLPHTFNNYDPGCPTETNCATQGDYSCDTPPHRSTDCGSSDPCGGAGVWENSRYNFMSYCSGLDRFTPDQKTRMRATMLAGPRTWLLNSTACEPSNFNTNVVKSNVSCYGLCDGSISVEPTCDGTYSYLWDTGETTAEITGLCQGNYHVSITDLVGRTTQIEVEVTQPDPVVVEIVSSVNVACKFEATGEATVSVNGGTPFDPCVAPEQYQVGDGIYHDGIGQSPAIYGNYNYSGKVQILIRASELQALGVPAGNMESVAFNIASVNGTSVYQNFEIQMGHTSVNVLTNWQSGLQQVLSPQSVNIAAGWNEYNFTTPFVWDGSSNVVLQTCFKNSATSYNSPTYRTSTIFQSVVYLHGGSPGACSSTNVTGVSGLRPNMRFNVCPDTSTYSYLWSNGQTTSTASGLLAGAYTVVATDANGCSSSDDVVITQPNMPLSVNAVVQNHVTCFGGSNGRAVVQVAGGVPPMEVVWSTGEVGGLADDLTGGQNWVTVTDAVGCVRTRYFQINEPDELVLSVSSQTNPSCYGWMDGEATVTASGGTPGYTYTWGNGSAGNTLTGLWVGAWPASVTDGNGCTDLIYVTISEPDELESVIINQQDVTCHGDSTGYVTVAVSGGTSEYSYLWSDGQTSATAVGLTDQQYHVSIIDGNGCGISDSVLLTSMFQLPDAAEVSIVEPTCASPTATINVISPLGAYEYAIDESAFQASTTFSGVGDGTYDIFVRNSATPSCVSTATEVTVTEPVPPAVPTVASMVQPTCAQPTGSITFTTQAGVEYSVGSGFYLGDTFTMLPPGDYTLTVRSTEDNTCTADATSVVTLNADMGAPDAPTVTVTGQPTCAVPTGSIEITAPLGAFEYSLDAGTYQTSTTFTNVAAGAHDVTVRRIADNTCVSPATPVTLLASDGLPVAASVSVVEPTCASPTATMTIDSPLGAYEYAMDGGVFQASTTFSGVGDGTYDIVVRNSADPTCVSAATEVTVTEPVPPAVPTVASTVQPTCAQPTGTISFNAQAGVEYSVGSGYQATTDFGSLLADTYTLSVRSLDDPTCVAEAASTVTINAALGEPTEATLSITGSPSCTVPTGTIEVTAPLGAYEYSLDALPYQSSTVFSSVAPGQHTVWVRRTDDVSCISQPAMVTVDLPPAAPVAPTVGAITQPTCTVATGSVVLTDLPASGTWILNPGAITGTGTSTTLTGLASGTYTYTVTNADGCISASTIDVVVDDQPVTPNAPSAPVATNGTTACAPSAVQLCASGSGTLDWLIDGVSQSDASTCFDADVLGTHTYTVIITENGCTSAPSSGVAVTIYAENVASITPNGPTEFCEGGSITLIASAGVSYLWSPSGVVTSFLNSDTSGIYVLTTVDGNGCVGTATQTVTVYPTPAAPTILWNAPTLMCSPTAADYQWYLDGAALQNDTLQALTPEAEGNYTVAITDVNGCVSSVSVPYLVTLVGVASIDETDLEIYPNPTRGVFTISLNEAYAYRVFNNLGSVLQRGTANGSGTVDISAEPAGVYVVQLITTKGVTSHRVLKT